MDSGQWHRLSQVNIEARTAVCSICGDVEIRLRSGGGAECMTSRRANRGRGGKASHEWERRYRLRKRYALSDEDVQAVRDLDRPCAICARSGRQLQVDHDHTCCPGKSSCGKCVRGFICADCNRGLWLFRDDARALQRAAEYLM